MEMGDGLPAMRAGVDHQPVAVFGYALLRGQFFRQHDHVTHQRLIAGLQSIDRVDVPVGDDENMRAGNRMNIPKCSNLVITIDDVGGGFTGEDLTEDAGHGQGSGERG